MEESKGRQLLTSSEAIRELNNFERIRFETTDGFVRVMRKNKSTYEIAVYIDGVEQPVEFIGNISNVLKTFNSSKINNAFYIESEEEQWVGKKKLVQA